MSLCVGLEGKRTFNNKADGTWRQAALASETMTTRKMALARAWLEVTAPTCH